MTEASISIKNIQAIQHLTFDLPSEGGVVVLVGKNGAGKTTAISAISALLGVGDSRLGVTRGEDSGEVDGLGRKLKVGKVQRVTGTPEVSILRGIDLSVIVDPKVADQEARNKYRIRELVSLGGAKVSPTELAEGCGELVDIEAASAIEDPIKMGDFLKRQLENAARELERKADIDDGVATAKLIEAGDVDDLAPEKMVPSESLEQSHRKAQKDLADARKVVSDYHAAIQKNAEIENQIAEIEKRSEGQRDLATVSREIGSVDAEILELKAKLETLEASKLRLESELKVVKSREATIESLAKGISIVDDSTIPTDDDIDALEKAEAAAYKALVGAADLERRSIALTESRKLRNGSVANNEKAKTIRELIVQIHSRLQKLLPAGPLEIDGGRLIFSPKHVPFDELSEGERWSVAMQYAIESVGIGGVIPISQEGWQSLAPSLKSHINQIAKNSGVVVITAQVDDGDLRAVEYKA